MATKPLPTAYELACWIHDGYTSSKTDNPGMGQLVMALRQRDAAIRAEARAAGAAAERERIAGLVEHWTIHNFNPIKASEIRALPPLPPEGEGQPS